jgi:hypothetical protein
MKFSDGFWLMRDGVHASYDPRSGRGPTTTYAAARNADTIEVRAEHAPRPWQVLLVGIDQISGVTGGSAERHEQGTLIRAADDSLVINLAAPA